MTVLTNKKNVKRTRPYGGTAILRRMHGATIQIETDDGRIFFTAPHSSITRPKLWDNFARAMLQLRKPGDAVPVEDNNLIFARSAA